METCRTCKAKYEPYGDGFDGECPSCADRRFLSEEFERHRDNAAHAIEAYKEHASSSWPINDSITDLLTDLMHLCEGCDLNFYALLRNAEEFYNSEIAEGQ